MNSILTNIPKHIYRYVLHLWDAYGFGSASRTPEEKASIKQLKEWVETCPKNLPGDVWVFYWPPVGNDFIEEMFMGSVGHIAAAIKVDNQLQQVLSQFPREKLPEAPNTMLFPQESMQREQHVPIRPEGKPASAFKVQVPDYSTFLHQAVRERDARMWFMRPLYSNETNCVVSVHRSLTAARFIYNDSGLVDTPSRMQDHLVHQFNQYKAGTGTLVINDATADIDSLYIPSSAQAAAATNTPSPKRPSAINQPETSHS